MNPTDHDRLRHMLDAARAAVEFADGRSPAELEADRMLQFALIRAVEVIGEAAGRVSSAYQAAHPEIPWKTMTGMRNRLIHGYLEVDLEILWQTVTMDLPGLIAQLASRISTPDETSP
jgi:uncharacterized protein with HEPN domain